VSTALPAAVGPFVLAGKIVTRSRVPTLLAGAA
jgi:hypothetical protein